MTIKVVRYVTITGDSLTFPVEADEKWVTVGLKLLDVPRLHVRFGAARDPEPGDDLEEMLDHQYGCFIEFADRELDIVSDKDLGAGIDLYCKTLEALSNDS